MKLIIISSLYLFYLFMFISLSYIFTPITNFLLYNSDLFVIILLSPNIELLNDNYEKLFFKFE